MNNIIKKNKMNYNKQYKFISDGTWFDKGTDCEVEYGHCLWRSDSVHNESEITYEELITRIPNGPENTVASNISGIFIGKRDGKIDSEVCGLDEFKVIKKSKIK